MKVQKKCSLHYTARGRAARSWAKTRKNSDSGSGLLLLLLSPLLLPSHLLLIWLLLLLLLLLPSQLLLFWPLLLLTLLFPSRLLLFWLMLLLSPLLLASQLLLLIQLLVFSPSSQLRLSSQLLRLLARINALLPSARLVRRRPGCL
jgi:hypothetical protein